MKCSGENLSGGGEQGLCCLGWEAFIFKETVPGVP